MSMMLQQTLSQLRPHYLPLIAAVCVTLLAAGGSEFAALFRFDREAILGGQIWRLFSGHLAHLSWSHLWLNIGGLALIWALVGRCFTTRQWLLIMIGSALLISAGLIIFNPQLRWYVGLSGVLHGMLMAGAIIEAQGSQFNRYGLLILIVAKLTWEQLMGPLSSSEEVIGGMIIVDAHFYGGLSGLLLGIFFRWKKT